jgi:hypothetical protein
MEPRSLARYAVDGIELRCYSTRLRWDIKDRRRLRGRCEG